ncbi:hypothetical protein ACFPOG_12840 [Paenibacillus aestuarii]|uniref:Uncharacterized protein n=1 Tax=Paenibacillus aestuarii TaxID=516965 RepID=A0ABW0K8N4_9BACL
MSEMFTPIKRILKLTLLCAILAFPILGIVQWIAPKSVRPFDTYMELLSHIWVYVHAWGDWGIVAIMSYLFLKSAKTFYEAAEKIRYNVLVSEIERWGKTPYIPPLLYFYLVSPPASFSSNLKDVAGNPFYQQVVDFFRNQVYVDSAFSSGEPKPKAPLYKVVGAGIITSVLLGVGIILGFFIVLYRIKSPDTWFSGWDKFFIPFIAFLVSWVSQQLYAIIKVGGRKELDQRMLEYFNEPEPRYPWRDMFPDRRGQTVLKAWNAEREKKQRYYYYLKNKPVPSEGNFVYDNPSLAPYPYPSDKIPEWSNEMEESVHDRIDRWKDNKIQEDLRIIKSSKGQVVPLHKSKKQL